MLKLHFFFGLFIVSIHTYSQDMVCGIKTKYFSDILNEERELWISVPEIYKDSNYQQSTYPVLYVLDPEFHFMSLVGVRNELISDFYSNMPNFIIVGVGNVDRTRDLTPTKSSMIEEGISYFENSGGADNFTSYLKDELMPHINKSYRTSDFNVLLGHSFGGLFAINTMINHPRLFDAHIAIDPSLWWDDNYMIEHSQANIDSLYLPHTNLYLASAGFEDDFKAHPEAIEKFHSSILQPAKNTLRWEYECFEKEDHGTIVLPSAFNAMKFLFEDYCLPVKEIVKHPERIDSTFMHISHRYSHQLIPEEHIIYNIALYANETDNTRSAIEILEINLKYYQESAYSHLQLGKLYLELNDNSNANLHFKRAVALDSKYSELIDQLQ